MIAMARLIGVVLLAATPLSAADLPDRMERPAGFPDRHLTIIVPYGVAGGSAQVAQAMARAVEALTGTAVILRHKPGASGKEGLNAFMSLPADGHAILEHTDDVVSAFVRGESVIDPEQDLVPLVTAQVAYSQIYIRSDETRFTDWRSFLDFAKKRRGSATIANVSTSGSMERVNIRLIEEALDLQLRQVSYDRPWERYFALKNGKVDALFEQPGDVKPFLVNDEFKAILTLLHERPLDFPEAASLKDAGLAFEPLMRFRAFYVKKGVPAQRLRWLQWAFQRAYWSTGFQAFNYAALLDATDSFRDTDGSRRLIRETVDSYHHVYRSMGLK